MGNNEDANIPLFANKLDLREWFIENHGHHYVYDGHDWFAFNEASGIWRQGVQRIRCALSDALRGTGKGGWYWVTWVSNSLQGILADDSILWNPDPEVVAFPDGTLQTLSGERRKIVLEDYITQCVAVLPVPGVPRRWNRFIAEMCSDQKGNRRPGVEACLLTFAASCLFGLKRGQSILFLQGITLNGKSVFGQVLSHIFGRYAISVMYSFLDRGGRIYRLGRLDGPRLGLMDSLETSRLDKRLLMDITGENMIEAKEKRGPYWQFVPKIKFFCLCNRAPSFSDKILKRRTLVVRLLHMVTYDKRDTELASKLKLEAPQILHQLLAVSKYWREHGLFIPEHIDKETTKHRTEPSAISDLTSVFLKERLSDLQAYPEHVNYQSWKDEVATWKKDRVLRGQVGGRLAKSFNPASIKKELLEGGYGVEYDSKDRTLDFSYATPYPARQSAAVYGENNSVEYFQSFLPVDGDSGEESV